MSSRRDAVPTKSIIRKNPKRYSCAAQRTHSTSVAASGLSRHSESVARSTYRPGDREAQLEPDRTGSRRGGRTAARTRAASHGRGAVAQLCAHPIDDRLQDHLQAEVEEADAQRGGDHNVARLLHVAQLPRKPRTPCAAASGRMHGRTRGPFWLLLLVRGQAYSLVERNMPPRRWTSANHIRYHYMQCSRCGCMRAVRAWPSTHA